MHARFVPEILFLLLVIAWHLTSGLPHLIAGLIVSALIGTYVAFVHPHAVQSMTAISLGLLPYGTVPGGGAPLLLILILWLWVATLLHWRTDAPRAHAQLWVVALIAASTLSVIAVRVSAHDIPEYVKWLIATSLIFPLLRMKQGELERFGKVFSISAAVASAIAFIILTVDKSELILTPFRIFGYGQQGSRVVQYVPGAGGKVERLAGTFIGPNGAGIFLLIALLLTVALFRGKLRPLLGTILVVGLAFTFSRAALGSLFVAAVLILVFHPMPIGRRTRTISTTLFSIGAAAMVPAISGRVTNSFGSSDVGSRARMEAILDLPERMHGNWLFGLGWGRLEFVDPLAAVTISHVANAPLLSVYRGGALVGIAFLGLLIHAGIKAFHALASPSWAPAVLGGGFLGFILVALQLDFPVVTIPAITAAFSVFLAFILRLSVFADSELEVDQTAIDKANK